jgi:hypothetical protein
VTEPNGPESNIHCALCGEVIEPGGPPGTLFFVGDGDSVCRQCMLKLDPASVKHADEVNRMLGTDPETN